MPGTHLTPATDLAGYLTRYAEEMTIGDEEPGTVMDRYHTPDYEMVSDGLLLDRQRLLDHARSGRKRVTAAKVEVDEALIDGDRVAARYRLTASMRKGNVISTEIYMFGRLAADGRLHRVTQSTRTIPTDGAAG
jgi:hypothetical protein